EGALGSQLLHHRDGLDAKLENAAEIQVGADVVPHRLTQLQERGDVEHRIARIHFNRDLHLPRAGMGGEIFPVGISTSFHCQSRIATYSSVSRDCIQLGCLPVPSPGQPEKHTMRLMNRVAVATEGADDEPVLLKESG